MVIQRLQNLYFLIATAVVGLFCFCPFLEGTIGESLIACSTAGVKYYTGESYTMDYNWVTLIITLLATILPLVAILRYKHLKLQRTIAKVSILFVLASAITSIAPALMGEYTTMSITYATMALPLIAIFFLGMAIKGINHDIRVLSSADRIR